MALATATAALIGSGLSAAGLFGGAKLQADSANKANRAQERAATEAMLYQARKEKQARDDYRYQYDAWRQQFYGDQSPAAPAAAPIGAGAAPVAGAAPAMAAPAAVPVAESGPAPLMGAPAQQPRTMADLAPWSARNFGQYLGQGGR